MALIIHTGERIQWPPKSSSFEPVTEYQEFTAIETDTLVWLPTTGLRIVLMGVIFTSELATEITLKGETKGKIISVPMEDVDKFSHEPASPIWVGGINEKLIIDIDDAVNTFITLYGHEDS